LLPRFILKISIIFLIVIDFLDFIHFPGRWKMVRFEAGFI
jgi:hypothetical protein